MKSILDKYGKCPINKYCCMIEQVLYGWLSCDKIAVQAGINEYLM